MLNENMNSEDYYKLDKEFVDIMLEVEERYSDMNPQEKHLVEQWTKKLCVVATRIEEKKNRNCYAEVILEMVCSNSLAEPFTRMPSEGPLLELNPPHHLNIC